MRLFIAADLPSNVRCALARFQRGLRDGGAQGRFVPPGNEHITLRFIGESQRLPELVQAMRRACRGGRSVKCNLGGWETFGGGTGYIAVTQEEEGLTRLWELMESALADAGFSGGRSRFVPHITVARNLRLNGAQIPSLRPEGFTVDGIVLYQSSLIGGAARYEPLHREEL